MFTKRVITSILLILTAANSFAQQWVVDEIADEVRDSDPIIFWELCMGVVLIGAIYACYKVIALIPMYFKQRNTAIETAVRKQKDELKATGKYKCPICGNTESFEESHTRMLMLREGCCRVRFCSACSQTYSKYQDKYNKWRKYEGTALPDSWCCTIYVIISLSIFALIGYHIYIGSMEYFWGRLIFGSLIEMAVLVLLAKGFIAIIKPIKPFEFPTLKQIKDCNALVE